MTQYEEATHVEARQQALSAVVTDLGPGNIGPFGPGERTEAEQQKISNELAAPGYSKRPTFRWICIDGRLTFAQINNPNLETNEADPQTAGGIVVSEMAAAMMEPDQEKPQSVLAAELTVSAIEDGLEVTIHGDDDAGKEGCKANVKQRDVLHFNAQNGDIVAPQAWAVVTGLGISEYLEPEDVNEAIAAGAASAENDALFDTTATQNAGIVVENGGEYEELVGRHGEEDERISLVTDEAFDKVAYVHDHTDEDRSIQAFAASLGHYAKVTFERAQKHGRSDHEAALQIMRVVLFNIGAAKMLTTEKMKTTLIVPAQEV